MSLFKVLDRGTEKSLRGMGKTMSVFDLKPLSAKPIGELKTKFDAYPGLEQYTVEVDNYTVVDGKYSYFDLPFTPSMFSLGADHRTLPLYISWHGQNTVRTEIDLPPTFKRVDIAPKSQELTAPGGGGLARVTSQDDGGKRVITHSFDTTPAIISPKDYAALLNLEAALGQKSSKVFLLEKSGPARPYD